jgi:hypothetical protein
MRRVLTPVRSEEEIRVPYECESNTEKTLFMTRAEGKLTVVEDNQNPLRVWVVLNTQGDLIEFVDKFLSLMGFNINDGNRR